MCKVRSAKCKVAALVGWFGLSLTVAGCGSGSSSNLPAPRPSADDDEAAPAVATQTTPGGPRLPTAVKPAAAQASSSDEAPANSEEILPLPLDGGLSVSESRRRSRLALQAIGNALQSYAEERGQFPPAALRDGDDLPTLSWRVELLPFLGYDGLYRKFIRHEPWDSPHNRELLPDMPPVYQSPGLEDFHTNYLMLTGPTTAMEDPVAFVELTAFVDGLDRTLLVLEADEQLSVPWTQPTEYLVVREEPRAGLFDLRGDGFFALLADGNVRRVLPTIEDAQLRAFYSCAGRESLDVSPLCGEPGDEPDEAMQAAYAARSQQETDAGTDPAETVASDDDAPKAKPADVAAAPQEADDAAAQVEQDDDEIAEAADEMAPVVDEDPRLAIPSGSELATAEALVRDVYRREYDEARGLDDLRELAGRILTDARRVRQDSAGFYVMLRVCRDLATDSADLVTALSAIDEMSAAFRVDPFEMKKDALLKAAGLATSYQQNLVDESLKLCDEAMYRDDFNAAKQLHSVAVSHTREKDDTLAARIGVARDRIDEARQRYHKVTPWMHALARDEYDPEANFEVGHYLCLLKRDWSRGLRLLSKGSHVALRQLAERDLAEPSEPEAQLALADSWWTLSEDAERELEQIAYRRRAIHWYETAHPRLPEGVLKLRVKQRVSEAEELPAATFRELVRR
jgi:hypothetical protein